MFEQKQNTVLEQCLISDVISEYINILEFDNFSFYVNKALSNDFQLRVREEILKRASKKYSDLTSEDKLRIRLTFVSVMLDKLAVGYSSESNSNYSNLAKVIVGVCSDAESHLYWDIYSSYLILNYISGRDIDILGQFYRYVVKKHGRLSAISMPIEDIDIVLRYILEKDDCMTSKALAFNEKDDDKFRFLFSEKDVSMEDRCEDRNLASNNIATCLISAYVIANNGLSGMIDPSDLGDVSNLCFSEPVSFLSFSSQLDDFIQLVTLTMLKLGPICKTVGDVFVPCLLKEDDLESTYASLIK